MSTQSASQPTARITSRFDRESNVFDVVAGINLHGKAALVTGAAGGFGAATARALAQAGASVYVADIDIERARSMVTTTLASQPQARMRALQLDLGVQRRVRDFAQTFVREVPALHILVNNAGIMAAPQTYTEDGCELQFAVNYLGHYTLTRLLEPTLRAAGGARVVCVSSIGHRRSDIRYDDLQCRQPPFNTWDAYGQSKTACALLAVAVDQRLRSDGVRSNTLNPGGSLTGLHANLTDDEPRRMGWLDEHGQPPARWRPPEQCASTATWLATAPELANVGARYFEDCQEALPWTADDPGVGVKPYAIDPANARRLWQVSATLAGLPD